MSNLIRLISSTVLLALILIGPVFGAVQHTVGFARVADSSVSYIEHHQYFESGEHLIRYYDNDRRLLLTKELSYPDLPQHPNLKQTDLLRQTEITIQAEQKTAFMTKKSLGEGAVFQIELTKDIIIDAGFDAYIRANWGSFEKQPDQQFRFAIAGQSRLIQMEISRVDVDAEGASFTVTPRNWMIRMILPATSLRYDSARQLIRYEGFSNLKQAGESRNVEISFEHYQLDTPLSMPLPEWLPAVSGL
ncbi:MAG: hypothetical protein O3C68_03230 [Proteobacteria bacterium]|nr:hypothetical protein [Pseudomonadota bacterium]